ncbi:virulence RhuM family protein [Patescibacteria group bacterium]|nr:virulence RhuM family protein [Patescibacteria group bacterium]
MKDYLITASDGKNYSIKYYNLDAIIAVGYRINSKRATHFRQRATSILKQYLVQGYNLNQPRLQQTGIQQVHRALELIRETLANKSDISPEETQGLLDVITRYTQSRLLLYQYDK